LLLGNVDVRKDFCGFLDHSVITRVIVASYKTTTAKWDSLKRHVNHFLLISFTSDDTSYIGLPL